MKRVGVFGSAFNPPHLGHKDLVERALSDFDVVLLVPSISHAFNKKMASFDFRIELLELFKKSINDDRVIISDVERELFKGERVYTYDVLNYLQYNNPDYELHFIVGPDNEENWSKFYKSNEIIEKWNLKVFEQNVDVRSTIVRSLIETGNDKQLGESVPKELVSYLLKNRSVYQGDL